MPRLFVPNLPRFTRTIGRKCSKQGLQVCSQNGLQIWVNAKSRLQSMQIEQLINIQQQKRALLQKREKLIHAEVRRREKEKINLGEEDVKRGFVEKTKVIRKKVFETVRHDPKKPAINIEDNMQSTSFLSQGTADFEKVLVKTKQILPFDNTIFKDGLLAISAFANNSKESTINLRIRLHLEAGCSTRPIQITLPQAKVPTATYVVVHKFKEEDYKELAHIGGLNIQILSFSEFLRKFKHQKHFTREIVNNRAVCFAEFSLFKQKNFFANFLKKGMAVFPIHCKKVPFKLRQKYPTYFSYLEDMMNHYYFVIDAAAEHVLKIEKPEKFSDLCQIVKEAIHQLVAHLLTKGKSKGNFVASVHAYTHTSIPIEIYLKQ